MSREFNHTYSIHYTVQICDENILQTDQYLYDHVYDTSQKLFHPHNKNGYV